MKKLNQKGFSIIEVLIVLAIAGLIMLVVFLAVPALQRNARNNARQSDASKFAAAVNQCLSNNNGKYQNCDAATDLNAATGIQWNTTADASQLTDSPVITTVGTGLQAGQATNASKTQLTWIFGYKCDGSALIAGTTREFAVTYRTEGASTDTLACINS